MKKINFENNKTKANADTFNTMQNNIEEAINDVVESGNNDNGNYVKYADGTMICYGKIRATTGTDTRNTGGLTVSWGVVEITYPISFIEIPTINFNVESANYAIYTHATYSQNSNNGCTITLTSSSQNYSRTISWIAIGKWK